VQIRAAAIVCAARAHGEAGVVARLLTADHGMVATYVAGGRGRDLRPVLIPGNLVEADLYARGGASLPSARLELLASRGPWLTEPLPAAAIGWTCALSAAALPERQAYPPLYTALAALLDAVCHAPSARGWAPALLAYEGLVLRELGYGRAFGAGGDGAGWLAAARAGGADWPLLMRGFAEMAGLLARYLLADRRGDVMGARALLVDRLARIGVEQI